MPLSITQRLTIMVALVCACIIVPTGITFYITMAHKTEAEGMNQANMNVLAVDSAVREQRDSAKLVRFGIEDMTLDSLRLPFDHWAVVRKNGHVEKAKGVMSDTRFITIEERPLLVHLSKTKVFSVASGPLLFETSLPWQGLPVEIRKHIQTMEKPYTFLSADSEVSGNQTVFSTRLLYSDHVNETDITAQGEPVESERIELSSRLPEDIRIRTLSGQILANPKLEGWRAFNGELVAIISGELRGGGQARVALNEFSEQFQMNQSGGITQKLDDTRLWIVAAHDMNTGFVKMRRIAQATAVGGITLWLFITLMAYGVTRHALKPVQDIVNQAERINPAQLDVRLPVGPEDDELSRISRTVNNMLDRLQAGYQREQQFTGDASHEMRNPLAKIIAESDLALSRPREPQEYEAILARLKMYAQGMQRLTDSLLMLARLDGRLQNTEIKAFDVTELAMEILKPLPQDSTQRMCLKLGESDSPMLAVGHRHLIGVLLTNLVENALATVLHPVLFTSE